MLVPVRCHGRWASGLKGFRVASDRSLVGQFRTLIETAIRIFLRNDLSGRSQQIAYNVVVTIAPLLIVLTAVCGLVARAVNDNLANPIQPVLDWLDDSLPAEAADFLREPIEAALDTDPSFLLSFGGILALWAAKSAINALMKGLNAAYDVRETRGFLRTNGIAILLTLGVAVVILAIGAASLLRTDVGARVVAHLYFEDFWKSAASALQGPVAIAVAAAVVLAVHRFAPNLRVPLPWYIPGSVVTVIGVVVAVYGLQFYFGRVGSYTAVYGVFGGVLVFLLWLYVIGVVILLGGLVNASVLAAFGPEAQEDITASAGGEPVSRET